MKLQSASETCPIINNEIDTAVVFSPKDYFEYKKNVEGCKIPVIPTNCIICFEKSFIEYAKANLNLKKIEWFRTEMEIYEIPGKNIVMINVNYGAALSAIGLEEAIALGVKQFVVLGSAGTLQDDIPIGSFVIAEAGIREEGVSYHYLKPSKQTEGSELLLQKARKIVQASKLQNIRFGTAWTTDSFYRETISKTKEYKAQGVLAVDMETSALYSVAKFRGVEALTIFYISDSIASLKWNPNFHATNSEETRAAMLDLAIKVLG